MSVDVKNNLEKRLLGYTALAGIVVAAGPSAQAAVIKTDPADQSGLQTIPIDFDGDFSTDLTIRAGDQPGVAANDVRVNGPSAQIMADNAVYNTSYSWNWYGKALSYGVTIGASKTFATSLSVLQYSGKGAWAGATEKYLGVKFMIGSNTHYGWIKLSCTASPEYRITLYEYAYESTAGMAIKAGSDASLPVSLSSFIAKYDNSMVRLQWITESETDNLGFILERQESGSATWVTVASYQTDPTLQGQGTTSSRNEYEYSDANVTAGKNYRYRLSDVDINGSTISKRMIDVTAVKESLPDQTELLAAYPNPFNPGTTIQYRLADDAPVTLEVIDITGRTVRSIVNENQSAGSYSFAWDGMDNTGNATPSGIYMLVLRAGNTVKTQKVTRLR